MKTPAPLKPNQVESSTSIAAAILFRTKVTALQIRREFTKNNIKRSSFGNKLTGQVVVAESRTPLRTTDDEVEHLFILGKIHNLRIAISKLNGLEVEANDVFSFWNQIGRATRRKGYVAGRELREGCLVPSIGGGLCQLSNALYDAALQADFQIVERHAHTRVIKGSLAEIGRDATVFWNYVDLRFKSAHAFRIEATLTAEELIVRFRGKAGTNERSRRQIIAQTLTPDKLNNCFNCEARDCFHHIGPPSVRSSAGRTAYLVDNYWPEFDRYIAATKQRDDLLFIPIDGKKFGKPNYAWTTDGFVKVKQERLFVLQRSFKCRTLASQGALRQRALLATSQSLAQHYASLLEYDITHITTMQQFVPHLWLDGHLGGRTFDVLMTSLPLEFLQNRLNEAAALHPESRTLNDFRADQSLVRAERDALLNARKIITPHSDIAALYPEKTILLDWCILRKNITRVHCDEFDNIVFPGPTVGRKGAYELRTALYNLKAEVTITGPCLEGEKFWDGVKVKRAPPGDDWLKDAAVVVLPAFVEHQPRRLLEAIARGVPVIASRACGLGQLSGVVEVEFGNARSLRLELEKALRRNKLGD